MQTPWIELDLWLEYVKALPGCWLWPGSAYKSGYGRATVNGKRAFAHKHAYEMLVGPVPDGLQLDHLCRNRACCNPAHLEPVTAAVNGRRGYGAAGINFRKKTCARGHPYEGENLIVSKRGWRVCRACQNAKKRRAYYNDKEGHAARAKEWYAIQIATPEGRARLNAEARRRYALRKVGH